MDDVIKTEEEKETKVRKTWTKFKDGFKKYAPIIFGGILIVVSDAAIGYLKEKKGYSDGYNYGHWHGIVEGCKLPKEALNAKCIDCISYNHRGDLNESIEEDPDFKRLITEKDIDPDDILMATKVYNVVTKQNMV